MTAESSYSLEALERRWQLEKTPQVGLRLAEEYRRKGELDSSIEALGAGLEVYPNHTASRVALSRYLVDAGRFSEAVDHLERIVSLDPAHLVANKLLVGAYAGVGRLDDARDKLAIYEMMGEGDADIERLHALLKEAEENAGSASEAEPSEVAKDLAESGDGSEPALVAEPEPEVRVPDGAERGDPETLSAGPQEAAADEPAPGTRGGTAEANPFARAPEPPAEESPDPFRPAPSAADRRAGPVPKAPAEAVRVDGVDADGETDDEPFGEPFGEVASSSYWEGVADEGIFVLETPRESTAAARDEPESARAESAFEANEIPAASANAEAAPVDAGSAALVEGGSGNAAAPESTVTLGKLYLEQGHRDEAAELFEKVLDREPDNEAARRELEAVTGSEPEGSERAEPASRSDRRRAVLITYRNRLRKAIAAGI